MLKRVSGKPKVEYYPKTASTLMRNGCPVALSSGKLILATAATQAHVGIILRDVLTTDADYASTTLCPVDVPTPDDIFQADVKGGVTAAATSVGATCDFFVGVGSGTPTMQTGEVWVDTGTDTHHQVVIVGFISAGDSSSFGQVLVKFNSLLTNKATA